MNGAEWLARALAGTGMSHVSLSIGDAPHAAAARRSRRQAHPGAFGKAAAYMADGYARVADRPGVCMAQSVGAANLASGLQDPWLGRSPVIALTGHKEPSFQHRNSYQEIAHAPLFQPVRILDPGFFDQRTAAAAAACLARRAGRHAASDASRLQRLAGRRNRTGQTGSPRSSRPRRGAFRCTGRLPTSATSTRAAAMLTGARRLVIVAGDGAAASGAGPEVLALAEALDAPVATTLGRARHHPDNASALGRGRRQLFGAAREPHRARRRTRAVHRLRYRRPGDTELALPPIDTKIVQIEPDPLEIGRSYPNTTGLVGDPKATLARLVQVVGRPPATAPPRRRPGSSPIGAPAWRRWSKRTPRRSPSSGCAPRSRGRCPGTACWLPIPAIPASGPDDDRTQRRRSDLSARGGLARLGVPGLARRPMRRRARKVVCFTGDGGFYYHLAELETARRYSIPATIVINNNSGFGQNLTGVRRISGNRPGRGEELIRFGPTDFTEVAKLRRARHPGRAPADSRRRCSRHSPPTSRSSSMSSPISNRAPRKPGRRRGSAVRRAPSVAVQDRSPPSRRRPGAAILACRWLNAASRAVTVREQGDRLVRLHIFQAIDLLPPPVLALHRCCVCAIASCPVPHCSSIPSHASRAGGYLLRARDMPSAKIFPLRGAIFRCLPPHNIW